MDLVMVLIKWLKKDDKHFDFNVYRLFHYQDHYISSKALQDFQTKTLPLHCAMTHHIYEDYLSIA